MSLTLEKLMRYREMILKEKHEPADELFSDVWWFIAPDGQPIAPNVEGGSLRMHSGVMLNQDQAIELFRKEYGCDPIGHIMPDQGVYSGGLKALVPKKKTRKPKRK